MSEHNHDENSGKLQLRWVVPAEESRAELAEWGLQTPEEQNGFYLVMDESIGRLHDGELELNRKIKLSREAARKALEDAGIDPEPFAPRGGWGAAVGNRGN